MEDKLLPDDDEEEVGLNFLETLLSQSIQNSTPGTSHSPGDSFAYYVKNNRFADAIQIARNDAKCLKQMTSALPASQLAPFLRHVLQQRLMPIIKVMWKNNPQLALYYSGLAIEEKSEQGQIQRIQLPVDEIIVNFKMALIGRAPYVVTAMWKNNPQLALYYSGVAIEGKSEQGQIGRIKISSTELMVNFKAALASKCTVVIEAMWKNNPEFALYYSGAAIEGKSEQEQIGRIKISSTELIVNFKAVLASNCIVVIQAMWENNVFLQSAINYLDDSRLIALTEKVLSSSKTGESAFIPIFLNFISKKHIVEACLNNRNNIKWSRYLQKQVDALNSRLELFDASSASSGVMMPEQHRLFTSEKQGAEHEPPSTSKKPRIN